MFMFKAIFSLNVLISFMLIKKKVYLLNAGIKAYLFYGEKISCNTGKSIIALWKSYVHKCSKV